MNSLDPNWPHLEGKRGTESNTSRYENLPQLDKASGTWPAECACVPSRGLPGDLQNIVLLTEGAIFKAYIFTNCTPADEKMHSSVRTCGLAASCTLALVQLKDMQINMWIGKLSIVSSQRVTRLTQLHVAEPSALLTAWMEVSFASLREALP